MTETNEVRHQLVLAIVGLAIVTYYCATVGLGVDYGTDARPAIDALAHARFGDVLDEPPLLGPVSIVLRAPFVALANAFGAAEIDRYRVGALACLVPVVIVALCVTRMPQARRQPFYARLAFVAVFCAAGPFFRALSFGHPEESLIGALAVATVAAAAAARPALALGILVLAAATKPTAILAAAPAFIALPADRRSELVRRIAPALLGAVIVLAAGALAVKDRALQVLNTGSDVRFESLWWRFASDEPRVVFDGVANRIVEHRDLASWVGRVAHILIPLMIFPAVLLQARFGRQTTAAAMALLALLMLLRCVFDPVSNVYYHVPFVMALAAWELLERPGLPAITILGAGGLWLALYKLPGEGVSVNTSNIVYLVVAAVLAVVLVRSLSVQTDERLREAG